VPTLKVRRPNDEVDLGDLPMRQKINDDPRFKAGFVAVLLLATLFLFMTRVKGGGDQAAPPPPPAPASADVTAAGATTTSAATPSPTLPVAGTAAPATTPSTLPTIDDAPLPTDLVAAYNRGDTVMLLLVRESGIDDRLVKAATEQVAAASGASLFVDSVSNVSRYTQITEAINLDRVPALIVLRPKRLSGGTATASVSYGFRDEQSIRQEIVDALYNGRAVGYSPD
jgi:hypothetical protein